MKKHSAIMMSILLLVPVMTGCVGQNPEAAGSNIETLREQNVWMEERIAELQEENAALRSELAELAPGSVTETEEADDEETIDE